MIIGHIGVRKGSKGVPRKNFKMICGKPLISWSFEQLLDHNQIDVVVVSTDDLEIYEYVVSRGALAIGLRPDYLATDYAGKWEVWQHSLSVSEALVGPATAFLDLDATSPLRLPSDISNALTLFFEQKPDMVMSCCEARKNPYFNLLELNKDGSLQISKPLNSGIVTRQLAPIVYEHSASTYVVNPEYLKVAKSLFEGRVIPYLMEPERCLDIDTLFDFKLVEFLLNERLKEVKNDVAT